MSGGKKRSGGMTAAELMAQLSEEYQRRTRAAEEKRQRRVRELRRAEQPIVDDLRKAGVDVSSVWDLVNRSEPYPAALPVLLEHLKRGGHPDRVMESLGRALAVKPAAFAWQTLRDLYLASQGSGVRTGLVVALAASAAPQHLDALLELVADESCGDTRILLLDAVKDVGGDRGRRVLEGLTTHPVLGQQARAVVGGPRRRSRPS